MSLRAYSEINLQLTWHVKNDDPVLKDDVEKQVHRFLRGQSINTRGVFFHEVGGTDNHIHLVVSTSPALLVSEWLGKLKGGCSHFINHEIVNRKLLEWQPGFGAVCFGTKFIPWVVDYVRNQRRRHAEGKVFDRLERTEPLDDEPGQGPEDEDGEAR